VSFVRLNSLFPPTPPVGYPSALTALRWTVCGERHEEIGVCTPFAPRGGPPVLLVLAPGPVQTWSRCGGYHLGFVSPYIGTPASQKTPWWMRACSRVRLTPYYPAPTTCSSAPVDGHHLATLCKRDRREALAVRRHRTLCQAYPSSAHTPTEEAVRERPQTPTGAT
jgi:hypothetical protein